MSSERFQFLVAKALERLPAQFQERLENVDIVVEEWPTPGQLARVGLRGRWNLLGLYEGVPITERGGHYGMVAPDKITIFQRPIEAQADTDKEIEAAIEDVVYHEIAHHFGINDERLQAIQDEELDEA